MKPVMQTDFTSKTGNCFQACVASILEIPLEDAFAIKKSHTYWYEDFVKWLNHRGFTAITFQIKEKDIKDLGSFHGYENIYLIASGKTPIQHAVIYKNFEQIHDPYPDGKGLINGAEEYFVIVKSDQTQPEIGR